VDPRLVEAAYQRTRFTGSLDTLLSDFRLRYGDDAERVLREVEGVSQEEADKWVEEARGELEALVESRIGDRRVAALYAAHAWRVTDEAELGVALELLGIPSTLNLLISWGLAMHFSDDVIASPPYLARLIMRLGSETSYELDVEAELEAQLDRPEALAALEAHLARGSWSLIEAIYEVGRDWEFAVGRLAAYRRGVGLVVNPATSSEELLEALAAVKDREARRLVKWLGIPGEYEFRRKAMVGVLYVSPSEAAAGAVLVYPWLAWVPRGSGRVIVVRAPPRRVDLATDDMLIFVWGGALYVQYPRETSEVQDYVLDLLYRDHTIYEEW